MKKNDALKELSIMSDNIHPTHTMSVLDTDYHAWRLLPPPDPSGSEYFIEWWTDYNLPIGKISLMISNNKTSRTTLVQTDLSSESFINDIKTAINKQMAVYI